MSNDLIPTELAGLPDNFGESLMAGISDTRSSIQVTDGKPLLRLTKKGYWIYGQEDIEVQEGARWALNLSTLSRGWVCWGDGELLGQVMASVRLPRIPQPAPIAGRPFAEQFGFEMTCITGEDTGLVVSYRNSSYGFKKAFDKLVEEIQQRWAIDKVHYWPVLVLSQESYEHKKFGEIWNPILKIVAWASADGKFAGGDSGARRVQQEPAPAPEKAAEEPAPAPRTRTRRPPATAAQQTTTAEPAVEPRPTAQAHTGQRRRPAAQ